MPSDLGIFTYDTPGLLRFCKMLDDFSSFVTESIFLYEDAEQIHTFPDFDGNINYLNKTNTAHRNEIGTNFPAKRDLGGRVESKRDKLPPNYVTSLKQLE